MENLDGEIDVEAMRNVMFSSFIAIELKCADVDVGRWCFNVELAK